MERLNVFEQVKYQMGGVIGITLQDYTLNRSENYKILAEVLDKLFSKIR